ncbi:hypothetical protein ONZ45_g14211 [Pleurotus djamor]|nr:hypothetical protein ONZ45_g14211 [Pleurotus djamor]
MRSHTGDRPYKCQYCGDQFARSDLLSRHVNKCHAGEKPSSGAPATGRRKGSASATRATTSKQACDQCVQSSLPCDGSNPCAKCIQRKCRCTYIKFHRQTAPIGPGHNPRPQVNSVSSRLPGYASADDFLLNPAPPIAPIPGDPSALSASYNHPSSSSAFTFPQLYPSTADSAPPSLAMLADGEYAKYRGQTDYLRRQTLPFPSGPGVPPPPSSSTSLGFDGRPSSATSWLGWGPDTTSQLAAGSRPPPHHQHLVDEPNSNIHGGQPSFTYPPVAADPYLGVYANRRLPQDRDRRPSVDFSSDSSTEQSMPSSAASSSVHLPLVDSLQSNSHTQQQHMGNQQQQQQAYHVSLDQLYEHIKDIFLPQHTLPPLPPPPNSTSTSQRRRSKTPPSSSIIGGENVADDASISQDAQAQAHASFLQSRTEEGGRDSGSPASGEGVPGAGAGGLPAGGGTGGIGGGSGGGGVGEGAGLSTDSAPFFTNNGMDMYPGDPDATPMPPKSLGGGGGGIGGGGGGGGGKFGTSILPPIAASSSGLTPLLSLSSSGGGVSGSGLGGLNSSSSSREAETRELKEFWKQYLRTPLSGTGSTPVRRLPPVERAQFGYGLTNSNHPQSNVHGGNVNSNANVNANGTSSMRTTLHGNPEDLRSYEAAVLARRAPLNLNLNLVPKRARGATTTSISGGGSGGGGETKNLSEQGHSQGHSQMPGMGVRGGGGGGGGSGGYDVHPPGSSGGSRPSSSASVSSSLAHAFGQQLQHQHQQAPPFAYTLQSHSHSSETPPSRGSTASLDESESDGFSVGGGGGGERHAHNHHPSHHRDWDSDIDIDGGVASGGGALRPSFKRLPSQTLGPANTKKRAMLEYDGEDEGDVSEEGYEGGIHPHRNPHRQQQHAHQHQQQSYLPPPSSLGISGISGGGGGGAGGGVGMMAPPPPSAMPSGSLANRRSLRTRRMSAPDTSPTVPSFAAAAQL